MKRRGEVFRRAFLICIVLLVIGNVLLVLAYTYFGKKTYVELERKSLSQSADAVQQLYARPYGQDYASTACLWYLESVSTSNNTSYILILDDARRNAFISSTNYANFEQDERLVELYVKLLSGESVVLDRPHQCDLHRQTALCRECVRTVGMLHPDPRDQYD